MRQGQGKINETIKQSNHNHNQNYNLMGFDTIEINLVSPFLVVQHFLYPFETKFQIVILQSLRIVTHTLDVKQHEMEAKMQYLGGNMETMVKQGLGNQMETSVKKFSEVCLHRNMIRSNLAFSLPGCSR